VEMYRHCIDDSFDKYYAVARSFSKVTAKHFRNLCTRIGAPIQTAPEPVRRLFNPHLIEDVYTVQEYAFDSAKLKKEVSKHLDAQKVDVRLNSAALKVELDPHRAGIKLTYQAPEGIETISADEVYNCTYPQINMLLADSQLPTIPMKHEVAELALVRMPEPLNQMGVTVMCGPFFSFMPFPPRGLHSFSHVRYTPHTSWHDEETGGLHNGHRYLDSLPKITRFPQMLRDAVRYIPSLRDCDYVDSLWEIKSVLPASERDDSRPILLKRDVGIPGLNCVLAAKIDNVFDVLDVLDEKPETPPKQRAA